MYRKDGVVTMITYEQVFEKLQGKLSSGEITFEQADLCDDLAFEKYVDPQKNGKQPIKGKSELTEEEKKALKEKQKKLRKNILIATGIVASCIAICHLLKKSKETSDLYNKMNDLASELNDAIRKANKLNSDVSEKFKKSYEISRAEIRQTEEKLENTADELFELKKKYDNISSQCKHRNINISNKALETYMDLKSNANTVNKVNFRRSLTGPMGDMSFTFKHH
jgi:uncharacterized phage infection (PIP) family protein YhgE